MNYVDIILAILLLIAAVNGFIKGFVEELAGLVALILGIWAAIHFSDVVADFLTSEFNFTFKHISIVAFVITFILVVILVNIIGSFVSKLVKKVSLGFLNRLAGLAFGVIKGAMILSIVLVIFDKIDRDVHILPLETKTDAKLYDPVKRFAPSVFPFLDFWGENNENSDPPA